jgi:solute carrier family 19 (thiamine transporter), member 2/3
MTLSPTIIHFQLLLVLYGINTAGEIAYFTYIYAKVARDKYQQVTGNARAALLTGRFLGSFLGQTLVSFDVMDVRELNYISMGGEQTLSFI